MAASLQILIADDDELLANLIAMQLRAAGYQAICVSDGDSAVSEALTYQFDVVIFDWQMPGMDGVSAARLLRQLGYPRPLVLLSASESQTSGIAEVDLCLVKPLQLSPLLQFLGQTQSQQQIVIAADPALTQQFMQALRQIAADLTAACHSGDSIQIRSLVHRIKGSAASFGAHALTTEADQLQKYWLQHQLQPAHVQPLLQLIALELNRCA